MLYIVYLDEFGHIGPYISKDHPRHNDSPVFGLSGLILPATEVRSFGTWFFNRKNALLQWEIDESGTHPAHWEKKGSSLYTVKNINKYPELKQFTSRFFNKITRCGGHVFYVGLEKQRTDVGYDSNNIYYRVLRETIKRLHDFCMEDCKDAQFMMIMDEHALRAELLTRASQSMYQPDDPKTSLIEPPFQVESHRYQTLQAADWISGLVGRLGAYWYAPTEYPDNDVFEKYFKTRITQAATRSSIRAGNRDLPLFAAAKTPAAPKTP